MKRPGEEGVALLTVLVMVAVMAALAVALLDDIRFSIRRTMNGEAVGQARWYALGAEELARVRIARLSQADEGGLQSGWNGRVVRFPVEGGVIESSVSDGSGCFNLNSVVVAEGDTLERRDVGVRQFVMLAETLGLDSGRSERLAGALVDWIDTDILRESGGAEDEAYKSAGPGYLTAGTLLAEPSELRAIRGFEPAVYAKLRPYICTLPTASLAPVNVNTLPAERAVLLTLLTEGALTEPAARRLIAERPAGGWASTDDFWTQPVLAALNPTDEAASQVQVRTRYFALQTQVTYGDAEAAASALLEDQDGRVRVVARRWGLEE